MCLLVSCVVWQQCWRPIISVFMLLAKDKRPEIRDYAMQVSQSTFERKRKQRRERARGGERLDREEIAEEIQKEEESTF